MTGTRHGLATRVASLATAGLHDDRRSAVTRLSPAVLLRKLTRSDGELSDLGERVAEEGYEESGARERVTAKVPAVGDRAGEGEG